MLMYEDKQAICNKFCETLKLTRAAGSPTNNALKELRYMKLDNGMEIVRPVFEDGTGENGYYDVNVSCDSGVAIIMDITKQFIREMW